jgi:hypothetical protein
LLPGRSVSAEVRNGVWLGSVSLSGPDSHQRIHLAAVNSWTGNKAVKSFLNLKQAYAIDGAATQIRGELALIQATKAASGFVEDRSKIGFYFALPVLKSRFQYHPQECIPIGACGQTGAIDDKTQVEV